MLVNKNPFVQVPEDITNLLNGIPETVCVVGDKSFKVQDVIDDNDPKAFNDILKVGATDLRKAFDQEVEKKLEEIVSHFGEDILKHLRLVMDPPAFSIARTNDEDFKAAITIQGRLEYHSEVLDR